MPSLPTVRPRGIEKARRTGRRKVKARSRGREIGSIFPTFDPIGGQAESK